MRDGAATGIDTWFVGKVACWVGLNLIKFHIDLLDRFGFWSAAGVVESQIGI
jgi:hypothetical protein